MTSITLITQGAADEIRTRDIQLGRLTLYQLSYHRLKKDEKARKQEGEKTFSLLSLSHCSHMGGGGGIRTYSAVKHQIYSLARLSNSGAPPWLKVRG